MGEGSHGKLNLELPREEMRLCPGHHVLLSPWPQPPASPLGHPQMSLLYRWAGVGYGEEAQGLRVQETAVGVRALYSCQGLLHKSTTLP